MGFMNKKLTKTLTVFVCLLVISAIGFDTVYGYGGSSGSKRRTTSTPAVSTGQVLGASTYAFNNNISEGTQNDEVRELQEKLRSLGFFTFHTSTGYFGPITLAAVKAFQTANGIPATGFVGPLTRAALNK
jgi:peptidoglycan hydrolase-like protein with peptidoglycan-binding domain